MKTFVFINPLKKGKIKEYQAFMSENMGPRKLDYIDLFNRYGLKNVKIYHHNLGDQEYIIVIHDGEDHALELLDHFSSSTNPYDRWFSEQLEKLHDFDGDTCAKFLIEFEAEEQGQLLMERETLIRNFFHKIEEQSIEEIVNCFAPRGEIVSPIFGTLEPKPFYQKLFNGVKAATFSIENIFPDKNNPDIVAVYITSSWKLKTEKSITLEGVNIFEFPSKDTRIQSVKFIYDTHLLHEDLSF